MVSYLMGGPERSRSKTREKQREVQGGVEAEVEGLRKMAFMDKKLSRRSCQKWRRRRGITLSLVTSI
jgi:hypothetical protein